MPVPNKWVYLILLLFLLFLILSDPAGTGTTARVFFGWIGDIFGGFFEFLNGLFGEPTTTTPEPTAVTSGSPTGIDQFNPNPELN